METLKYITTEKAANILSVELRNNNVKHTRSSTTFVLPDTAKTRIAIRITVGRCGMNCIINVNN